jgi:hypothetical protein
MEIVTYVLEGALEHKDSMGTGSIIWPGDVQRMSAGKGVFHSEWNHSKSAAVHFLQIWLIPDRVGIAPSYEQRAFAPGELCDQFRLVGSRDGRNGSVTIHQDVGLHVTRLSRGRHARLELAAGRFAWVQIARGSMDLNGVALEAGDGAAVSEEARIELRAADDAEVLVFDLA